MDIPKRELHYSDIFMCQTREDAAALLEAFTQQLMRDPNRERPEMTYEEVKAQQLSNIGYFAGYGSQAEANRALALFGAEHPLFGTSIPPLEDSRFWAVKE